MSMKIDEVMMGDIVSVSGNPIHVTLAVLNHWSDNIKPILLTPEILEKNGFEKHINDTRMFFHHNEYRLSYYLVNKHFTIYNQIDGTLIQKIIVNVHELQHALKFCEIDKEIVV